MLLPFTPLAGVLGFTPLPLSYFVFVAAATIAYLLLVEVAKRALLHRATQHDRTALRREHPAAVTS
jgi:Mg2+-importing ATPase